MNCHHVQFQSMNPVLNCQPVTLFMNCRSVQFQSVDLLMILLCSMPRPLGPWMLCLSRVSQCSLGPSPCRGLQVRLLHRGGLLLRSGGLLLHRGVLLLRSGGLLLRLLRPGGLQSRMLRPGGLQFRRLRPGFLLCQPQFGVAWR